MLVVLVVLLPEPFFSFSFLMTSFRGTANCFPEAPQPRGWSAKVERSV